MYWQVYSLSSLRVNNVTRIKPGSTLRIIFRGGKFTISPLTSFTELFIGGLTMHRAYPGGRLQHLAIAQLAGACGLRIASRVQIRPA